MHETENKARQHDHGKFCCTVDKHFIDPVSYFYPDRPIHKGAQALNQNPGAVTAAPRKELPPWLTKW